MVWHKINFRHECLINASVVEFNVEWLHVHFKRDIDPRLSLKTQRFLCPGWSTQQTDKQLNSPLSRVSSCHSHRSWRSAIPRSLFFHHILRTALCHCICTHKRTVKIIKMDCKGRGLLVSQKSSGLMRPASPLKSCCGRAGYEVLSTGDEFLSLVWWEPRQTFACTKTFQSDRSLQYYNTK